MRLFWIAALALSLTACSAAEEPEPPEPVNNLEVMAESEATDIARKHAGDIAEITGEPLTGSITRPIKCRPEPGRTTELGYSIQSSHQIVVGRDAIDASLMELIKVYWTGAGHTMVHDNTVGGRRSMRATAEDGYTVDMQTDFPEGYRITVYSPCYAKPAPGPSSLG